MQVPVVRAFRAEDVAAVYDVCLRAGLDGADATGHYAEPDLFGHVWAGPYLAIEPEHCLVVEDDEGVAGYCLATADSRRFEAACEQHWWPALRQRLPDPAGGRADLTRDEVLAHLVHHPIRVPDDVAAEHPAHLHVDLLPRLQGRGLGRAVLDATFDLLARAGAPGVHLGVSPANSRALGFYRHLGLAELSRSERVVILGRPLP